LLNDEGAFAAMAERHRNELHVHCYRMLGSFHDAQDLVQETFLKAWRKRDTFQGRSAFRAWLYRIATNACLDFLARHPRRVLVPDGESPPPIAPAGHPQDLPWLQPFPDRLLEAAGPSQSEPDAVVVTKETIELAFLVAIQFLSPKQRAALILCDVMEWSAREAAELLGLTVPSVNGALRRARATIRARGAAVEARDEGLREPTPEERHLLDRYVEAGERGDARAIAALLRDDVRFSMPPEPGTYVGRDVVVQGWVDGGFGTERFGVFRSILTRANRLPAVACYLRRPGQAVFLPLAVDVLRIEQGAIAEITAFPLAAMLDAFGLPDRL